MKLWAIRSRDGWQITDLSTGGVLSVVVREITEEAFKHELHDLNCGASDLCVLHLPFGLDVAVSEFVDGLIAETFDFPARFFAVRYGDGFKAGLHGPLEPADTTHKVLNAVIRRHVVISESRWNDAKTRRRERLARLDQELARPAVAVVEPGHARAA